MWAQTRWFVENLGNILLLVLGLLMTLGFALEMIARLIPTEKPDSLLTRLGLKLGRFGMALVNVGKLITSMLDFIKFPNRLKK